MNKAWAILLVWAVTGTVLGCFACASTLWGNTPSGACGPFGHYYDGGGCCPEGNELTRDGLCRYVGVGAARDGGHE